MRSCPTYHHPIHPSLSILSTVRGNAILMVALMMVIVFVTDIQAHRRHVLAKRVGSYISHAEFGFLCFD